MQRLTITFDDSLMEALDAFITARGYQNRSEALRDLARSGLEAIQSEELRSGPCVGAALYVYDHEARELAKRVTRSFHDRHDLALATLHVHLDHDSCLEVTVLKGERSEVRACAARVIAERGVRHGRIVEIPVDARTETHRHGPAARPHTHLHVRED